MLYIIQSVIMKALWDPEAGWLLSLKLGGTKDRKLRRKGDRSKDL